MYCRVKVRALCKISKPLHSKHAKHLGRNHILEGWLGVHILFAHFPPYNLSIKTRTMFNKINTHKRDKFKYTWQYIQDKFKLLQVQVFIKAHLRFAYVNKFYNLDPRCSLDTQTVRAVMPFFLAAISVLMWMYVYDHIDERPSHNILVVATRLWVVC